MTETVHLAVYDTLADWEYGYVAARLNSPDWQLAPGRFQVRTVGPDGTSITTMGGVRIEPDLALDELDPADSAMLVLPGASQWGEVGRLDAFCRTARDFLDANVPVAAICGATLGLAREGLLDDRVHTSNSREELAATGYAGGERYRQTDAISDRGVITAAATDPAGLAREVFTMLEVFSPDVIAQWSGLFGRQPA